MAGNRWVIVVLLALAAPATGQENLPMPGESTTRRQRTQPKPLPPPTEQELGVPVYPGATYDGTLSGGMSQPDSRMWLYFSSDPVAKVLAFYEQKTGKKGESWEKDKYLIKLAGQALIPDHGVSIETLDGNPMLGNRGKTVITVMRNVTR